MARLSVSLLGTFRVCLDDEPVTRFESGKVRALLAYLAVEAGRPQRRGTLTGLLWPEQPERSARHNLSQALYDLRRAIGDREAAPPFLTVTRESIQFNADSDHWLDVAAFASLLANCKEHHHRRLQACDLCMERLEQAVALYGGEFLEGISIGHSLAFEEWSLLERDRLHRLAMDALSQLAGCHEDRGDHEAALQHAWRQLELDAWREEAHRQLMRLLARLGRRSEALAQYEACRRLLAEELGVEPSTETTRLYRQIRNGELKLSASAPTRPLLKGPRPRLPAFLDPQAPIQTERPVFVARERELAQLNRFLDQALAGQGRVIFVTGGPGRGKTALMREFAWRAMVTQRDLLVATGSCNAYSGIGDPYLPFRELLGTLTRHVEARWAVGAISNVQAQRLWAALPLAVQTLLQHGPSLIDTLIPGAALLSRAAAAALPQGGTQAADDPIWLSQLRAWVEQEKVGQSGLEQSALFEQCTNVLCTLAARHPLLLILDDLQWADAASISLLFHLGRQLPDAQSRVLVVGAYRPEEVALRRRGERHPLKNVLAEFKRRFGDVWVDLARTDATEGRRFVDAFVDSAPNRLGEGFRRILFQRTQGHPLFTVELLRAMQERGNLVQDQQGRWVEGARPDWEKLPARVEGMIEARVGRLEGRLRDIVAVASVEGERFTAQVVAQVLDVPERDVMRALSQELGARHRLTREGGETRLVEGYLTRYQFTHVLFQAYLYSTLSAGERRSLHGEVAAALEALHGEQSSEIAVQLARHYAAAGNRKRAVAYLLQAGDSARALYAHQEAIDHYQRALEFLKAQKDFRRAARTLMKLGLTHHLAFNFQQARAAYDEGFALWQRAGTEQPVELPPAPHAFRTSGVDPSTLDPTLYRDTDSIRYTEQLFSGLAELTPEMDIAPDVARAWDVLDGGRKYVFHLRDDVVWSDGRPVTARDFVYAWKRTLDPATGSRSASLLYDIRGARAFHQGRVLDPEQVGVRALDPTTLIVELDEPTAYFPHLVATWGTYPVPRHVVEAHGAAWTQVENIVTNGPFKLQVWRPAESIVLVRNLDYHGQFTGNLQRVKVRLVPTAEWSASLDIELYEADELELSSVDFETDDARRRHAEEYVTGPRLMTLYLAFDASRPPFDDVRVRQAFVLATDRGTMADVVLGHCQFPATGGFLPPGMPGHSPGIALPYDLDQARHLLTEAGYPGGAGFPAVEALAARGRVPHSAYLQAQWQENLGVEIAWEAAETGKLIDRLNTAPPHMCRKVWGAEYPDPDNFLRTSTIKSETRWSNAAYDLLVDQARRTMDQRERITLYQQADRILIEEAAIMPLTYLRLGLLIKPWVQRYPLSPVDKRYYKDVIIEPH